MPFALIFQVVLLPQGELRDPGTCVCVCVKKGQELRAAERRWHEVASFQTSAVPHSIRPKSCSGRSTHSNPVPNKTTDKSRWEWELWKDQPPLERACWAYQCLPFEQSGTQKKEALSHEENKRESKVLIKDKGNLFHSALYCDLNLLEVRAKRAANSNWQEYHAVISMGFEKSWEMTSFLTTLQDILKWSSWWYQLFLYLRLFTRGCSA